VGADGVDPALQRRLGDRDGRHGPAIARAARRAGPEQAVSDTELLAIVTACHPGTIRTMKWTVQKLKEASPQVLAS
jgi:hypothetical protein